MSKSIYTLLTEAKQEISSWQSDLYVPVNPVTIEIVNNYKFKCNVKTFKSNIDGKLMYDIPFSYDPFWQKFTGVEQ
jgi:hypothetical protein